MEVLVVLVIIGMMTGLVAINLNADSEDPDEMAAETLARAVQSASRRAILEGVPQGLAVTEEGWSVRGFSETGWQDLESGNYPDRMRVEVLVQDVELEVGEEPVPVTVWEPTGGAESFEMRLDGREAEWVLRGDTGGDVTLERGDD